QRISITFIRIIQAFLTAQALEVQMRRRKTGVTILALILSENLPAREKNSPPTSPTEEALRMKISFSIRTFTPLKEPKRIRWTVEPLQAVEAEITINFRLNIFCLSPVVTSLKLATGEA